MQIRPYVPETDLEDLVRIINQINRLPVTVAEMWQRERNASPGTIRRRAVAFDASGRVIGYAGATWASYMPEGRFGLRVMVEPEARRTGIGTALYEEAVRLAREEGARELESSVREEHADSRRFAEKRGFRIRRHLFGSSLDLTRFDESPFVDSLKGAEAAGFRFFTLAEVPDTEETRRRYYDLDCLTNRDIPGNDHPAPSFADWQQILYGASWFRPDCEIMAAYGEQWAGATSVGIYPETGVAYHSYTGVHPDFRGQGLAQALKLLSIRAARRCGMTRIRTDNDSENGPMLAVNRKYGYVPEPGEYWVIREGL